MSQVGVEDLLTRSSRQSCFRNPASQGWSPGFRAAGCIVRKVIPLDTTPVCCVQYGAVPVNIACNWSCTQDLYARLTLTDNRRANSYSKLNGHGTPVGVAGDKRYGSDILLRSVAVSEPGVRPESERTELAKSSVKSKCSRTSAPNMPVNVPLAKLPTRVD